MTSERSVPPTLSEVAEAAGVSRVGRRAHAGRLRIREPGGARAGHGAAAERIGYRANALARSMSTGVTQTLGVIVADIANPFFGGVVRGISDSSRARGFDTIVLSTHEDLAEEVAAMNVLIDKRVDGIVLASRRRSAPPRRGTSSRLERTASPWCSWTASVRRVDLAAVRDRQPRRLARGRGTASRRRSPAHRIRLGTAG